MQFKTIHEDDRGSIFLLTDGFTNLKEVTIFKTNEGYARGGCIHNFSDEHVVVIEGEVIYVYNGIYIRMQKGDTLLIPKGTPHYFISKTNSVVMEWGPDPKEKEKKHPEYRKLVNELNVRYKQ